MAGARDDLEATLGAHATARELVLLEDEEIVAADNEERRRLDADERWAREVGTATARDDRLRGLCRLLPVPCAKMTMPCASFAGASSASSGLRALDDGMWTMRRSVVIAVMASLAAHVRASERCSRSPPERPCRCRSRSRDA